MRMMRSSLVAAAATRSAVESGEASSTTMMYSMKSGSPSRTALISRSTRYAGMITAMQYFLKSMIKIVLEKVIESSQGKLHGDRGTGIYCRKRSRHSGFDREAVTQAAGPAGDGDGRGSFGDQGRASDPSRPDHC